MRPIDEDDLDETTLVGIRVSALAAPIQRRLQPCLVVLEGPSVGLLVRVQGQVTLGRSVESGLSLNDGEVSRNHAIVHAGPGGAFVEDLASRNGTFVNNERVSGVRALQDGDKIQLGSTVIVRFAFVDEVDTTFQMKMYESALRDGLTGAFNRAHLNDRLVGEVAYALRHRVALSVLLFDVDHFKTINDTLGHPMGDVVLRGIVERVQKAIRASDVLARYGGEEFCVLARGTALEGAMVLAERIRQAIAGEPFRADGHALGVTVSVGLAGLHELGVSEPEALLAKADEALYASKHAGRNRVTIAR